MNKIFLSLTVLLILSIGITPIWAGEDLDLTNYEIGIHVDDKWGNTDISYITLKIDGMSLDDNKCYTHSKYSTTCDIIMIVQNEKMIEQSETLIDQNKQIISNLQKLIDLQTQDTYEDIYGDYP